MNSVDKIIKVFGGEGLGAKARAARNLGMSWLNRASSIKNFLIKRAQ